MAEMEKTMQEQADNPDINMAQAASAGEAAAEAAEKAKRSADAAAGAEAKRLRLERKAEAEKKAAADAAVVVAPKPAAAKKPPVKRPKTAPTGNEICLSDGEDEVVCTPGGAAAISLDLDDDDAAPAAKPPKFEVTPTDVKPAAIPAQDASTAAASAAQSTTDAKTEELPAAAAVDGDDGAW